jgi:DNA-binding NtrC family response regulator
MRLLLVEDDRVVRLTVRDALEEAGYDVTACADAEEALVAAAREPFPLVLTDIRLPGLDGVGLFRRLREAPVEPAVVLMTAYADTEQAVGLMREGARDYIIKPFEMDVLLLRLDRVRQEVEFRREMEARDRALSPDASPEVSPIRGRSEVARRLREQIDAAAACDFNVLIVGETGTGKELCARTIHAGSARGGRPFIAVNCAAIPEHLFEAEMFGHEKGAFTGADRRRVGRFEAADGGTLLLDELGELPLAQQVKLLRAIETHSFEPVGSSRAVHADVRVISATNRDLGALITAGRFRRDLYYRINVLEVYVPSLRERRADIPVLVGAFLAEIATRSHVAPPLLDADAAAALAAHDYPGNVRELIHALEHAVAIARGGPIRRRHLPRSFQDLSPAAEAVRAEPIGPLNEALEQFEKDYIHKVLEQVGGHRGRAAALLGISRKTLWQRLREDG